MKNKIAAQEAEAIRRAALIERRAGIVKKPLPPKFEEYVPEFLNWSKQHHRDKTYKLHRTNCHFLLRYFTGIAFVPKADFCRSTFSTIPDKPSQKHVALTHTI